MIDPFVAVFISTIYLERPVVWNCIQKSLIYLGNNWKRGGQALAKYVMFASWVLISGGVQ